MSEKLERDSTKYELTKIEERIIEVLIDPQNRMKSVTDICGLVPCDRKTYYNAFKKPGFVAIYKEVSKELVNKAVGPVINAFIKEASRGSFQHGKVLLEMADLYSEKVKQEITGKDGGPIKTESVNPIDYSNLTDEEVKILTANKAWVADPVKAKEIARMLLENKKE
jgi:hypothetical protein